MTCFDCLVAACCARCTVQSTCRTPLAFSPCGPSTNCSAAVAIGTLHWYATGPDSLLNPRVSSGSPCCTCLPAAFASLQPLQHTPLSLCAPRCLLRGSSSLPGGRWRCSISMWCGCAALCRGRCQCAPRRRSCCCPTTSCSGAARSARQHAPASGCCRAWCGWRR